MPNPQFIEEKPLTLVDVKEELAKIVKKDKELNYRSNKTREYLGVFVDISLEQKKDHPF